ncbi:hypothetical protein U9M48_012384 [Paspalum notatum var. saurae]|uniref:DUF4218 domain-containing protein n=1 Tax=Paspalum notatum var. saurae TaxID=547442 RepID=A0AAQ3WIC1_PASNO
MMVHLTVHLATDRLLCKYKSLVRTRSHPEGAIAEGCQFNEIMTFYSWYLHIGLPLSGTSACELSYISWIQAQRYVLMNYVTISAYVKYVGDIAYYGRIIEIIELNYSNMGHVVLLKCDCVDSVHHDRGVRKDKFRITQVNFNHLLNSGTCVFDELFIFF